MNRLLSRKLPNQENRKIVKKYDAGYTLIELIVTIVIITIVAAIAVSRFQSAIMTSNEASAVSAVKLIANSQISYQTAHANFGSIEDLVNANLIDSAFVDNDGDPNTGTRSGFVFQFTSAGENFVISGIPKSSGYFGSGRRRVGADNTGFVARDDSNITAQYASPVELRSGTSVPYDSE